MEWFIAYLISVIVVPTLFGMIMVNSSEDRKLEIKQGTEVFMLTIFCLLWPVSLTLVIGSYIKEQHRRARNTRINNVIFNNKLDETSINRNDRSFILSVPEQDLKYLMKMYRRGKVQLSNKVVEVIREELQQRVVERGLLS